MTLSKPNRTLVQGLIAATLGFAFSNAALADINVGVILSTTGPGASLGQPADNTVKLWPAEIAGQKVRLTILNDNTDPTEASKAATRLIAEQKVDVIVGSSLTPASIAVVEVAGRNQTPVIALGGGGAIIEPQEGPKKWAFKMAAPEALSVAPVLEHMVKNKVKNAAVISVATAYGEGFLKTFRSMASSQGVNVIVVENYNAADLSVTAQVLKVMSANPDAVYIFSFGTPGAAPQMELVRRNYKGLIYQTHGVANGAYLKLGGKDIEGGYLAVAPVLVAEQLPENHPTKKQSVDYVKRYEGQHGAGTRSLFGSVAWTAYQWLEASVPVAMKRAKPGTPEFRAALRDALEGMKEVATPDGVYNMSPTNHNGLDERAQVLVKVEGGTWKLIK